MAEDKYSRFRKEYGLPDAKSLSAMFEIEVKGDGLVVQSIRNDILGKVFEAMKTLESILFTGEGSDPSLLYQEKMVSPVSDEGFDLFKTLNEIYYSGARIKCEHDVAADADFIKRVFKAWPEVEKGMAQIFAALEKGWKEISLSMETRPENYHG